MVGIANAESVNTMKRSKIGLIVTFVLLAMLATSDASSLAVSAKSTVAASATANGMSVKVASSASASRPAVAQAPAWHNVYPDYNAIKMISSTSGWIVGQQGVIKHLYNGGWGDYPSPVTNTLNAVDVSGSDGWAVGDNNTILQLVGTDWQVVASPAPMTTTLADVKIVAPGEAWAIGNDVTTFEACRYLTGQSYGVIGDQPYILHYSGGSWQQVNVPIITSSITLNQMSWGSPTDGWFVGSDSGSYDNAVAFHYNYDNGTWTNFDLTNNGAPWYSPALSIHMSSATEGWLGLCPNLSPSPYLMHFNGTTWQPITLAPTASQSPLNGSIAATGTHPPHSRPAGGAYAAVAPTFSILSFAPGDYYAAGFEASSCVGYGGCPPDFSYGFLRHNGTDVAHPDEQVNSISGVAANDIWAIGPGGAIYHWDGTNLSANVHGLTGNKIQMLAANDGWLNNGAYNYKAGILNHYDGTQWTASSITNATSFAFDSSTDGWAAAENLTTTFFTHYDGSNWSTGQSISGRVLAMQMLTTTEGWAVGHDAGQHPAAFHYSNGSWSVTTLTDTTYNDPTGISFDSASDGWVIGMIPISNNSPALIYHYSGGSWSYTTLPTTTTIPAAVYALAPNDVWVGGETSYKAQQALWHYDGSIWTAYPVPTDISAIQMFSSTEGWAGGDHAMLHYTNGSWQVAYIVSSTAYNFNPIESISFDSPTDGWAVGPFGALHYFPQCLDYYADVPAGNFAAQAVFYLSCHGIVSGTGNHIFSPNAPATRIQFAKMITLARGWPLATPTTATFSDVPPSNPLYTFVETAYANGAISGATPATCAARGLTSPCFLPNDNITRAQTAVITVRSFGWPINTSGGPHFSDVPTSNFAYGAIETCYNRGVVNGIGGGLFAPNTNVTRAQLAVILYKALTLP